MTQHEQRCPISAGTDPCHLPNGHAGSHETYWGDHVVVHWTGDESWSHHRRTA